jgi:hypothetical protein
MARHYGERRRLLRRALDKKPMNTSGSARQVKSWLRFAVQHPGANCTAVAIANLRFITSIFHQIKQHVEKDFTKYSG